jgi:ABC-type glycerol-3-phosphate transport system substrate-binding protein
MLKMMGVGAAGLAGSAALAACQTPEPVKETVVVEKEVEKTVIVEKEVEKVVTATPVPRENVTITFGQAPIWRTEPDNRTPAGEGSDTWIKDAIQRFQALYPWITVDLIWIPWNEWGTTTGAFFSTGEVPNVMYGAAGADNILKGLYDPFDPYLTQEIIDNWIPGMQEAATAYGFIYSLPVFTDPSCYVLSKTALEESGGAGILDNLGEDRGGLTFDMLEQFGKEFSGGDRWMMGVRTLESQARYWTWGAWMWGWGVETWDETHERFVAHENPNAVKALQWYVDAQNDWKIVAPDLPAGTDIENLVFAKRCAAFAHWPNFLQTLAVAKEADQAPDDLDLFYTAMPHLPEVGATQFGVGALRYALGHEEDPDKKEAAARWALWLGNDDSNAEGWMASAFFPVTKSGAEVLAQSDIPIMENHNVSWVLNHYFRMTPGPGNTNSVATKNIYSGKTLSKMGFYNIYAAMMQSLMLGEKTPAEVLQEMAETANTALGVEVGTVAM